MCLLKNSQSYFFFSMLIFVLFKRNFFDILIKTQTNQLQTMMQEKTKVSSLSQKRSMNRDKSNRKELWKFSKDYDFVRVINSSKLSEVFEVKDCKENRLAVKKLSNPFKHKRQLLGLLREITLLHDLQHQNIVKLIDVKIGLPENDVYLFMEFINGDIKKLIKSTKFLKQQDIQHITFQLLLVIKYLDDCNVLHRDLKPQNILICQNLQIKVCDFGLARIVHKVTQGENEDQLDNQMDEQKSVISISSTSSMSQSNAKLSAHVVTRYYRAPQVIVCQGNYGIQIDLWSAACIFAELLKMISDNVQYPTERVPLFPGQACYPLSPPINKEKPMYKKVNNFPHSSFDQLHVIFEIIGTPSQQDISFISNQKAADYIRSFNKKEKIPFDMLFKKIKPQAIDFLNKMLLFNPKKRLSVDQAINHPLFDKVKKTRQYKWCKGKKINKNLQALQFQELKKLLEQYLKQYELKNRKNQSQKMQLQ